jgi:PIN like domain
VSLGEARILFDECIPRPILDRLAEFIGPQELQGTTLKHLFDIAPPGTFDEDWIPKLKDEGWTVVSADGGRSPNKRRGKKLPHLCAEYGITLIILSPAVHRRKSLDKARTLLSVWDQIVKIAADPSLIGKRYALEPLSSENLGIGRLVEKVVRPPPPRPA